MPATEPPPTTPTAAVSTLARAAAAPAGLVVGALAVVYVVWGSTYLGIRVVVEEAPPLASSGARYVAAGLLLGLLLSLRGGLTRLRVTRRELPAVRRWDCSCRCSATGWSRSARTAVRRPA